MTTELLMLTLTALLVPALVVVLSTALQVVPGGLEWGMGNREGPALKMPAWVGRVQRAHANLAENLAPFAALVLVAHALGRHDPYTVAGAVAFFALRVLHAVIYIAGIPKVRSVVFFLSITAECVIGWRILAG